MREGYEWLWLCRCGQALTSEHATCVYCGKSGQGHLQNVPPQPGSIADKNNRKRREFVRRNTNSDGSWKRRW